MLPEFCASQQGALLGMFLCLENLLRCFRLGGGGAGRLFLRRLSSTILLLVLLGDSVPETVDDVISDGPCVFDDVMTLRGTSLLFGSPICGCLSVDVNTRLSTVCCFRLEFGDCGFVQLNPTMEDIPPVHELLKYKKDNVIKAPSIYKWYGVYMVR